jgi:tetratricopeptide (TPR) repeat protein
VFEQASRFVDAMQQYHSAAEFDPSWFEAQYDYAVLCQRLGDNRQSLGAYEMALAIQPDSVDARYNFALALKAAGYVPDAVHELKRLLSAHPDEVRGHLALASIYAKKLHDTARAREHYLKALDLDPNNPQAAGIRNWLSANPE